MNKARSEGVMLGLGHRMAASRRKVLGHAVATCALVVGAFGTAPLAKAAELGVKAQVLVILAKEDAGEIDTKLKSLRALQKPPFNAYKSMKVLSTNDVDLTAAAAATVALPNGRTLQLKLLERMPDGRNKVQVSINRPEKPDYLPLLTVIASAEPFFVAGQRFEGGTLVIGVRVGETKP